MVFTRREVVVHNNTSSEALILESLDLTAKNGYTLVKRLAAGTGTEFPATKFMKRNRRLRRSSVIIISVNFNGIDYELRLFPEDFVKYVQLTLGVRYSGGQAYFAVVGVPAEPSDFLRRQWAFGFLRDYTGRREHPVARRRILEARALGSMD